MVEVRARGLSVRDNTGKDRRGQGEGARGGGATRMPPRSWVDGGRWVGLVGRTWRGGEAGGHAARRQWLEERDGGDRASYDWRVHVYSV
jgi:hypothetical protein